MTTRSVAALQDLAGRVALVTGGAGHLGEVIAEALAECGASVALVDRDGGGLDRVATRLTERTGRRVVPLEVDLADEQATRGLPDAVRRALGRLDVLVNCAALVSSDELPGWTCRFEDQSLDTWRRALEVNLTAAFALSQASAGALRESGAGSIVNIGSIYGVLGPDPSLYQDTAMGSAAAYAVSKGGLIQLTRWLATMLAPEVRVNAISCGGLARSQPAVFQTRYARRTPLGRMGREEDVKGATVFLASDLSAYVTGQNLLVDGGWSAW